MPDFFTLMRTQAILSNLATSCAQWQSNKGVITWEKNRKQNKKCFNITIITAAAKKSIWFLPLSYSKKLLRCSSQVWGSCFDYKLFEYYISSQTATFCCRQIELFSYKYSQCLDNVLITNFNGYLTGFVFFFPHIKILWMTSLIQIDPEEDQKLKTQSWNVS